MVSLSNLITTMVDLKVLMVLSHFVHKSVCVTIVKVLMVLSHFVCVTIEILVVLMVFTVEISIIMYLKLTLTPTLEDACLLTGGSKPAIVTHMD